jgi:hypothetical protein
MLEAIMELGKRVRYYSLLLLALSGITVLTSPSYAENDSDSAFGCYFTCSEAIAGSSCPKGTFAWCTTDWFNCWQWYEWTWYCEDDWE